MAKKPTKLRPISGERFEREVLAITRLCNAKLITAGQHKARYDVLLKRLRQGSE